MKKVILLSVGALVLASVTAYAQMQHRQSPEQQQPGHQMMQGPMHGQMQGPMHGKMQGKMHGKMHSGMHGGQGGAGEHGAQGGHDSHSTAGPSGDTGPSSLAFHGINVRMHEGMNIAFSGNADVDFVKGMIPHHQGAVDMAKVLIAFGKDPELRILAEAVVRAQETEIALMNAWLQRNAQ